jgi:hypothetical protein
VIGRRLKCGRFPQGYAVFAGLNNDYNNKHHRKYPDKTNEFSFCRYHEIHCPETHSALYLTDTDTEVEGKGSQNFKLIDISTKCRSLERVELFFNSLKFHELLLWYRDNSIFTITPTLLNFGQTQTDFLITLCSECSPRANILRLVTPAEGQGS